MTRKVARPLAVPLIVRKLQELQGRAWETGVFSGDVFVQSNRRLRPNEKVFSACVDIPALGPAIGQSPRSLQVRSGYLVRLADAGLFSARSRVSAGLFFQQLRPEIDLGFQPRWASLLPDSST